MTKTLVFLFLLFISFAGFSQRFVTNFIYGRMVKENDTLTGYFRFSPDFSQNGQTVYYKEKFRSDVTMKFPSRKYDYFESDSFYLETFKAVPDITGNIKMMIPRIINGKLQLFAVDIHGIGFYNMESKEFYFIKKGDLKLRIKKGRFKEQIQKFVGDDETLMQKIEVEELKYEDMIEIVKTYNSNHI